MMKALKREPNAKQLGWHDWFWKLIYAEWRVEDIADGYGMSPVRVREILDEELIADHEWLIATDKPQSKAA